MRAPISSRKHYVQVSLATIVAGAINNTIIVSGVSATTENAASEVREGAIVKAVFVEMWVRTNDTAAGTALVTLSKNDQLNTPTFAEVVALDAWNNKKNVFYHTQGLTNDQDSTATPFIRQWFKIPKGKQRFGLGDRLILTIAAQALDQNICGFMTYKEYN